MSVAQPELEQALELIDEFCTKEQVTALLRRFRESDRVKISSPSKKSLIQENLREALVSGAIQMQEAFNLIRNSEENGSQHIWLYRPKPNLSHLFDADDVAERLWGKTWASTVDKLPSLELKPEDYVISDFRRSFEKPRDWYLKVYGHTSIVQPTGKTDPRGEGIFWREFETLSLRTVILIRWNSPDVLEIRVQKHDSRKRVLTWHEKAWSFLRPAFLRDQFRPWQLGKVLSNLVENCEKHKDLYDFRDAKIMEADGSIQATYEAMSDQGSLLESKNTAAELKRRLKEGDKVNGLAVTWKSEKTSLETDLRVLIAAKQENEILVPAHCSPKDLDHVTDQLRRFS